MNRKGKNMGSVIWISGISASGKTTLGEMLSKSLENMGYGNIIFLDGEVLRNRLKNKYGHSIKERYKILNEYIKIANQEIDKGYIVIISTISHKKEMRDIAKSKIDKIFEVNLVCSPSVCARRDYKNQYEKAIFGKYDCFPGITEMYELSEDPDLIIDTDINDIENSFSILFKHINKWLKS